LRVLAVEADPVDEEHILGLVTALHKRCGKLDACVLATWREVEIVDSPNVRVHRMDRVSVE